MTTENIIKQILSKHPELSRRQILKRLELEKKRAGGLISDETLLQIIAEDFGVELPRRGVQLYKVSIDDLIPNLNDVTILGRVVALFSPKVYQRVKTGKVARLLIADQSGTLSVVLWNEQAHLIESGKLKISQIIRVSHGYTRKNFNGKIELHIGNKSEIEINPQDINPAQYPTIRKFITKLGEIASIHKNKRVNVSGTVKYLFSIVTFKRRNSTLGKVLRFQLSDETGEIPVVIWNEKTDELKAAVQKDVSLQIVNAKIKENDRRFEIHVDQDTYVNAHYNEIRT